jgi:hypothetical protein
MPGAFITSDLSSVFNPLDFGEPVGSVTVNGVVVSGAIFDDADVEINVPGETSADIMRQPTLTVPSADVPNLASGQLVVARGVTYRVQNWRDDDDGTVTIYMGDV